MVKKVLGISAFYHDSAAILIVDGEIAAGAHEERFTRKKHDKSFPKNAIRYVLNEYGIPIEDVDLIVFYEKPYIKFERLIETYLLHAPRGLKSFLKAMPEWFHGKFFPRREIKKGLQDVVEGRNVVFPKLIFSNHHLSHAASAFYPSPFQEAAIVTIDGVGEWSTASIAHGKDTQITTKLEMHFPNSIGLLYSAFTYYCGFKVNSGEYKLMGLAPYGEEGEELQGMIKKIKEKMVTIHQDGSITVHMKYFDFATGLTMCRDAEWEALFGIPRREEESEITQSYMNLALAIQRVTEEIVLALTRKAKEVTGSSNVVLAGGVALNCVANSKIVREEIFKNVWIQPASGDAGGALGAAYVGYYIFGGGKERTLQKRDSMKGSYLGPSFTDEDIIKIAHAFNVHYTELQTCNDTCRIGAELISKGNIVGWFQGRMEWGPRALGNRSILADPRDVTMQKKLNLKIKFREGFRPFAPSVLEEEMEEYFEWNVPSPYMLFVAPVQKKYRKEKKIVGSLYERLYEQRSTIPAVTHMDYSARLQTVSREDNEMYWKLIQEFKRITGCGLVINTSFNVRGEPIVCTPLDAYKCFLSSDMDYLIMGNILFDKKKQPGELVQKYHKHSYALD